MGSIFKRGKTYWIRYYQNGKCFRESAGSESVMAAKSLLKIREGEISQGKIPGVTFDRVTFDELAEGYLRDYRINQKKSLAKAEQCVWHLKRFFGGRKVPEVTTPRIETYIEAMVEAGKAVATINRDLAALKRMLNLGAQQTPPKVDRVPYIPRLVENNVRKGFFEHAEFIALHAALPDYLKGFCTFGYKTGWRVSEIAGLTWPQVDRDQGIVRLEVGETKNDAGRTVYLDDELKDVINHQWAQRRNSRRLMPYVFPNFEGTDRVKRFDKSWATACRAAKIPKRLFHDLRRTAVRNMIRAGIPERVAMMISGHKTRAVFDRYNIVNDADLKLAAQRQAAYISSQDKHKTSTIEDFEEKKVNSLSRLTP